MGNVQVRLGSIFSNSSDLVLLPCSAKGNFVAATRENVRTYERKLGI